MPHASTSSVSDVIEIAGVAVEQLAPRGPSHDQAILFIHGMWCGAWVWRNYLSFFSALGYACYALNLRGHHPSRPVSDIGKVSVKEYLTDVRDVAGALGNPILIGHSMGGLLVQKLAEEIAPPAVVAITPAAPRGIFALRTPRLLWAAATHAQAIALRRPLIIGREEADRLALNGLPLPARARIYDCFVPESGCAIFEIACLGLRVDQSRLRGPMLVIAARHDNLTPVKLVKRIAKRYGAAYREYARNAHMIIMEPGWSQVAEEIAAWLSTIERKVQRIPEQAASAP
jgi:pimeloyl-ACP methyl ester carboxylesterase